MPQEARVGIKFESIGVSDVLQQIGSLAEALGQAGRVVVNPYNPALSMSGAPGTMGTVQMAGEPGTFSSGGYPAGMPGYGTGPGYVPAAGPGYQMAGGMGSASITVGKVDVINVQSASVVNIYGGGGGGGGAVPGGGGFIGGGGPGYGPSPGGGGIVTPYGITPNIARDQSYAEYDRSQVAEWFNPQWQPKSARTGSSFAAPWQHLDDFILPPAQRVGPDPMSTPSRMASDAGLQRYYDQFASGQTDAHFAGTSNDPGWQQQQYSQWVAGGGKGSFSDFLNTGKMGGGGGGFAGAMGRGAIGLAAASMFADYLSQAATGRALSEQQQAAAPLEYAQSFVSQIPLLGGVAAKFFQPEINRLKLEGDIADRGQLGARTTGAAGMSEADYEHFAQGSSRNFWRTPFLQWDRWEGKYQYNIGPFSNDPRRDEGFSYIPSGDANELVGLAGYGQIGMTTQRQKDWLGEEIDDPNMRPEVRKARARLINEVRQMAISSSPELASQLIGGGNIRGTAPELLAIAQMQGDFGGVQTVAGAYDTKYDIDFYRQSAANTRILETQHTLAQQGTAMAGINTQLTSVTQQGGYAVASAIGGEAAALDVEISAKAAQLATAEQQNAQAPTQLGQTIVNQKRIELLQLQAQRAAKPMYQIDARFQADTAVAGADTTRGQSGLQLASTMGLLPGTETATAFAQINAGDTAKLRALEKRLQDTKAAFPNAGAAVLEPIEAAIEQQRNVISGRPFQIIDDTYRRRRGMGDAQVGQGETAFGLLRDTYSTDTGAIHSAFARIGQGLEGRLAASRERLAGLRRQGLGDDNTEVQQTLGQIAQDEASHTMNPAREREGTYQNLNTAGEFLVQGGRAALGRAFRTEGFGGASERAQGVIMSGLNEQLEAALRNLQDTLRAPHTVGQERRDRGRVEQAQAAIQEGLQSYIQAAAQDLFGRVGQAGTLAGIGISGLGGAGFAPGPGMQEQRRQGIESQAQQAEENARNSKDPAMKRQWEQQAAQLRAQLMSLPLQEIEENLSPGFRTAGAQQGIASAEVQIARQYGAGSADTRSMEIQGVQAAEREAELAGQRVSERRKLYQEGKIDKSMVDEAEAQESASKLKATQLRTGLGQVNLPLAMREQREVTEYSLNVLKNTPGAYGNVRGLLQSQMGQLENEAEYIRTEMRERPGTPEAQHQMRQRLRDIGLQQHNTFQELSHGWELQTMSSMINTPGTFNMEGRGFAFRDAIMRGIRNPHFGMRGGELPTFLREANLQGGISLPPGVRNADSDHVGTPWGGDVTPAGFGRFGRAGRFGDGHDDWHDGGGSGWGGRPRASFPTRPGATAGSGVTHSLPGRESGMPSGGIMMLPGRGDLPDERGGGGGGGQSSVSIEVIIKNEKGDVLGRGRPGAAGFVTEGVMGGGLEDALTILGIGVVQQN